MFPYFVGNLEKLSKFFKDFYIMNLNKSIHRSILKIFILIVRVFKGYSSLPPFFLLYSSSHPPLILKPPYFAASAVKTPCLSMVPSSMSLATTVHVNPVVRAMLVKPVSGSSRSSRSQRKRVATPSSSPSTVTRITVMSSSNGS